MQLTIKKINLRSVKLRKSLAYDMITMDYVVAESGIYVGQLVEIPGVISQGVDLRNLKANIIDALTLYLECENDN